MTKPFPEPDLDGARLPLDCSLHGPEHLPPFRINAPMAAVRQILVSFAACALAGAAPSRRRIREDLIAITREMINAASPAKVAQRPFVALATCIEAVGARFGGLVPALEAAGRLEIPETDESCHWWAGSGFKVCEDGLFRPDSHPGKGKSFAGKARNALVVRDGAGWRQVATLWQSNHDSAAGVRVMGAIVHMGLAGCVPSCEVHAMRMNSLQLPGAPPSMRARPFGLAAWYRDAARGMLACLRNDAAAAADAIRKLARMF
jgi:hypothetical protein